MHVGDRFGPWRPATKPLALEAGRACHVSVFLRGRQPWLADFHVACEVVRGFRQPQVLGDACLLAWVLMPDHVQWLIEVGDSAPLEKTVARMKSASAVLANRMLARAGPLWEPGYQQRLVDPLVDVRAVARAVVAHPVRAGLVAGLGDHPFWDLAWL